MPWIYKKSRIPYELPFDDYDNFLNGLPLFADDHSADPDFYPHYALIPPLIDDYHVKFIAYTDTRNIEDERNDEYHDDAIEPLRDALVGLRRLLPALFDVDSMLADFGINKDIEVDVDKLIVQAEICRNHWAELCDPVMPPEYAPVQGKLDAVAGLITNLIDARHAYAEAVREKEIAQNALEISREAINHEERRMFNWYRGLYTDPQHMIWEESPWGTSSGGEEEPPAPEWPDWPGPVEASAEQIDEGLVRITYSGLNGGKTLRIDRLKQGEADYVLVTQGLPLDDPEEVMPFDDNHLDKKKYTYKLTPFNEEMEAGVPALVEVTVS